MILDLGSFTQRELLVDHARHADIGAGATLGGRGVRVKLRGGKTRWQLREGRMRGVHMWGWGDSTDVEGFDTVNGHEGEIFVSCTQPLQKLKPQDSQTE